MIESMLRHPLILVELALCVVGYSLALVFTKRHLDSVNKEEGKVHLAWLSLVIGYTTMTLIYIFTDFYILDEDFRYNVLQLGYLSAATGGFFFIVNIEQLPMFKVMKRYPRSLFSKIFLVFYVILLVLIYISWFIYHMGDFVQAFATLFWLPTLALLITYTIKIAKQSGGELKVASYLLFVGVLSLSLGILGATDFFLELAGLWARFLADGMQVSGLLLVSLFMFKLSSWAELQWKEMAESLFVMYKGGTFLFQHDFGNPGDSDENKIDPMMIAGALETSRTLLNEFITTGRLATINFKDKILFFRQGQHVSTVLVARARLNVFESVLRAFQEEFETFFKEEIDRFAGNIEVFQPAVGIVDKVFR